MRAKLIAAGTAVAGAALVGVALVTLLTGGPRDPAAASIDGPAEAPVLTASVAHAGGIDDAVRELDLIRPPRPKQASDFTVSLLGGETLRLKGQRGKPVLVNFWATWCAPCREEMPAMQRLYLKHRQRGFVLLGVSVDTDAALVKPFLERFKLTFPVALDTKMDLANAYGVRALPASFL
ncbi:MAG TPA: TlpA disulfide reductase family protein, partial [Tepidisphaeraceae bacterium]